MFSPLCPPIYPVEGVKVLLAVHTHGCGKTVQKSRTFLQFKLTGCRTAKNLRCTGCAGLKSRVLQYYRAWHPGAGAENRTYEKVPRICHVTFCQQLHKPPRDLGTYLTRVFTCHMTVFLKMYLFLPPLKHRRKKGRAAKKAHPHTDLLSVELSNCD